MAYEVWSYDNLHLSDPEVGPRRRGKFDLAVEAVARAQAIIETSLRREAQAASSVEDLKDRCLTLGEVPTIHGEPKVRFNPYAYMDEVAKAIFAERSRTTA